MKALNRHIRQKQAKEKIPLRFDTLNTYNYIQMKKGIKMSRDEAKLWRKISRHIKAGETNFADLQIRTMVRDGTVKQEGQRSIFFGKKKPRLFSHLFVLVMSLYQV